MSLAQAKAQGGRVEVVYSTLEALELARKKQGFASRLQWE